MEVLIVGLGGVGSKGFVGGPIRQLTVGLGKVVILVRDNSRIALIGGENEDVGVGAERAECGIEPRPAICHPHSVPSDPFPEMLVC